MATEPIQSGPYPLPKDPPDGPNQMSAIVTWAAGRLNMRFASAAARNAAIPAPVAGMECTIGSGTSQVKYIHDGTEWRNFYSDTGWMDLTAIQNGGAQGRIKSGALYLRGTFSTTAGGNWPAGVVTVGKLPNSLIWPGMTVKNTQVVGVGENSSGVPGPLVMWIDPAANIQIYTAAPTYTTVIINALSGHPL